MCFSAEVSFTAAAVLSAIGYQSVRMARTRSQLPLAFIPWLFALHQFSEGVLWVYLGNHLMPDTWVFAVQNFYIFMAYLFIPIYFPATALVLEPVVWRRRVMMAFLAAGVLVSFLYSNRLPGAEIVAQIVGHSIQYPYSNHIVGGTYMVVVCFPFLFSSQRAMWRLGTLGLCSIVLAWSLYLYTFASVWCFFAAIISISILGILRQLNRQENNQTQSWLEIFRGDKVQ